VSMVDSQLGEHPFLHGNEFANDVIASFVLAYAIVKDLSQLSRLSRVLSAVSARPFLWRSFARNDLSGALIEGSSFAHVLSSYWTDPLKEPRSQGYEVVITGVDKDEALAEVPRLDHPGDLAVTLAMPIEFYGEIRESTVRVAGEVRVMGRAVGDAGSVLSLYGPVDLHARELSIECAAMVARGPIVVDADIVNAPERVSLDVREAQYWWSEALALWYPWSLFPSTLPQSDRDEAIELLERFAQKSRKSEVVVGDDRLPIPDDQTMLWATHLGSTFSRWLGALEKAGVGHLEQRIAAGPRKFTLKFNVSLADLLAAASRPGLDSDADDALRRLRSCLSR
ncbi:MAG: hypothetical protein ABSD03_14715, partial [Vulcanimicrobiaceae bacterium]